MAKTTSKEPATKSEPKAGKSPASKSGSSKAPARKSAVAAAPKARSAEALAGLAGEPTAAQARLAQRAIVQADTRNKTRTVALEFAQAHAKYGKIVRKRTNLQIHDETNDSRKGDLVEIAPCRPVSKSKRWRLVRVVERRSVIDASIAVPSA